MRLTLLVPGFHAAVEATRTDLSAVPPPFAGLRLDDTVTAPASWQAALCETVGLVGGDASLATDPDDRESVPAANAFAIDTGLPVPPGRMLRADPVGWVPDRDSAIAWPPESLGLDAAEADALLADLNAFLAEDGVTLTRAAPERWYASADWLPALAGPPPEAFAFAAPPPPVSSTGAPNVKRLRSLQGELEMLLHAHPVNEARRAAGRQTVTGLYWWGSASDWRPVTPNDAPVTALVGDEPFARVVADARGIDLTNASSAAGVVAGSTPSASDHVVRLDASLRLPWLRGDVDALVTARNAFREAVLAPSLARAKTDVVLIAESGHVYRRETAPRTRMRRLVDRLIGSGR